MAKQEITVLDCDNRYTTFTIKVKSNDNIYSSNGNYYDNDEREQVLLDKIIEFLEKDKQQND